MARLQAFALPDLGEGLTEAEILSWSVAVGDTVALNQVIVEVETAKAAVEVPSPYAGVVTALHHEAGSTVDVGAPLLTVDTDPSGGDETTGALVGETAADGRTATLVGYGPRTSSVTRRPRVPAPVLPGDRPLVEEPTLTRVSAQQVAETAARTAAGPAVLAKPPVRKLARELGVDLASLPGTGPGGTVTRADVQAAADRSRQAPQQRQPAAGDRRVPVTGVRRLTAEAMVASAFTAPHVTEFLTLDVTPTMQLRERVQAMPEFAGLKVTPLLFVARALLLAVRRHPEVNSTFLGEEILVKRDVNLGIAAATPRGLLVPNVKDAGSLDLLGLARALQELTETARAGRTTPAALQGGSITITNVGSFGVDNGTPLLHPGESAILCLGAVRPMPWVHDGQVVVRQVTQLALSFDHRSIDGQLGSQFLADVGRVLADPATALLWC